MYQKATQQQVQSPNSKGGKTEMVKLIRMNRGGSTRGSFDRLDNHSHPTKLGFIVWRTPGFVRVCFQFFGVFSDLGWLLRRPTGFLAGRTWARRRKGIYSIIHKGTNNDHFERDQKRDLKRDESGPCNPLHNHPRSFLPFLLSRLPIFIIRLLRPPSQLYLIFGTFGFFIWSLFIAITLIFVWWRPEFVFEAISNIPDNDNKTPARISDLHTKVIIETSWEERFAISPLELYGNWQNPMIDWGLASLFGLYSSSSTWGVSVLLFCFGFKIYFLIEQQQISRYYLNTSKTVK